MQGDTTTTFWGEFDPTFDETSPEIQQGDVVEFLRGPDVPAHEEWGAHLGLIVTADCDIAWGKHGGVLSYLPIVPVAVYLRLLLLPSLLDAEQTRALKRLDSISLDLQNAPSSSRIAEMAAQGPVPLELYDGARNLGEIQKTVKQIELLQRARATYSVDSSISECVNHVENALSAVSGKPSQSFGQHVGGRLRSKLDHRGLADDLIFMSRPTEIHDSGYVIYLRLLREIPERSIALSAVSERKLGQSAVARRVGRLSHLYLHKVTQQLGNTFARIGLPTAHEQTQDLAVVALIDALLISPAQA